MKIINQYSILSVALLASTLFTACERTELCYDHFPTLNVGLSWEHEWERDYGMNHASNWDASLHGFTYDDMRPERPEWVNMVISKPNGTSNETYLNPEGGEVSVDLGSGQSYLLYNGDTEYIMLSDMTSMPDARATATSRTRSGMTYMNEHHPNVRSTNPPDVIYAAYVENAPEFKVHDHHSLDVKMQPLVYTYVIRYEFDYGLEHVSLARGALGGMAESVYLRDGHTSENASVILFDCDVKPFGCEAHVRSFGIPSFSDEYYGRAESETPDLPFSLNLEILLRNGKIVEYNYDIADQMKKQPRGGVITISGLRIEDQIGESDSGFNVDVDDWPEHDVIDLPIEVQP
ncbi:MAG: DUF5119 domain-containing protein [Muribaculaceae bacterium]|nr:DUF5119 domain-containing protein [Muribaculaceae bacterium]MDE7394045.1 DUF5119 domain-containing protein [Muribaculaceae bacterium]